MSGARALRPSTSGDGVVSGGPRSSSMAGLRVAAFSAAPCGAEIDSGDLVVGENFRRRALDQHLPEVQNDRSRATFAHDANHMLDDDDRGPRVEDRFDQRDELGDLAIDQSGADFVEQHDPAVSAPARAPPRAACGVAAEAPAQADSRRRTGRSRSSRASRSLRATWRRMRGATEYCATSRFSSTRHIEERAGESDKCVQFRRERGPTRTSARRPGPRAGSTPGSASARRRSDRSRSTCRRHSVR